MSLKFGQQFDFMMQRPTKKEFSKIRISNKSSDQDFEIQGGHLNF